MKIQFMPDDGRFAYWIEHTESIQIKALPDEVPYPLFEITWDQYGKLRTMKVLRISVFDDLKEN